METIDQAKTKMLATIEHLKTELKSIRTGRANPGMVDSLQIEVYGSHMRVKDLASISCPDSKQLLITPFDPKNVPLISKAIEKANIGVMPLIDGNSVRLKVPPMDENMRKEMIKISHKKKEEAKVGFRNIRREANDHLRHQKAEGKLPEDQLKKGEKQIQELTDKFCEEAEKITKQKEDEITHV